MTKDVLITIEGLQLADSSDGDKIEVITPGSYYYKNNYHYVRFEEVMEGSDEVTRNTIKFDEDIFSITKRGYTNVDMVFEENKRNMTNYVTPYGTLLVGIDAENVDINLNEDIISINIDYGLNINYEHIADCKIKMDIRSKTEKTLEEINL